MRNITRAVAATACAAVIGVGTAASAQAAMTVTSVGPAKLMAKGVTVAVPLTGTCDIGLSYTVGVTLTEKTSGNTVVQGSASTNWMPCDQGTFATTLYVKQQICDYNYNCTTTMTFKKGAAVARVDVTNQNYDYTSFTSQIRIS